MKSLARNILAIISGLLLGSLVNSLLVALGPLLIPVPAGLDTASMEGLQRSIHLLPAASFVFPWLAHAVGTVCGAFVAARLAVGRGLWPALSIGAFFLAGGIAMVLFVGGPAWFTALDLGLAYIPMALLGHHFAATKPSN